MNEIKNLDAYKRVSAFGPLDYDGPFTTVVEDASTIEDATLSVSVIGLPTEQSEAFRVVVDDGSSTWEAEAWRDGYDIRFATSDSGDHHIDDVTVNADFYHDDLNGDTVDFEFGAGVGNSFDIRLENADDVYGGLEVLVDNEATANVDPNDGDLDDGELRTRSVEVFKGGLLSTTYHVQGATRSHQVQIGMATTASRFVGDEFESVGDDQGDGSAPGVGYPETYFVVDAGSVDAIESGDDVILEVSGSVTNIGGVGGSQTIHIDDTTNGENIRSTPQALDPGASTSVSGTYDPPSITEDITFEISSEDDSDTTSWGGSDETSFVSVHAVDFSGEPGSAQPGQTFDHTVHVTGWVLYYIDLEDGGEELVEVEEGNTWTNDADTTRHTGDSYHDSGSEWQVTNSAEPGTTGTTCVAGEPPTANYVPPDDEQQYDSRIDEYTVNCFDHEIEEDDEGGPGDQPDDDEGDDNDDDGDSNDPYDDPPDWWPN